MERGALAPSWLGLAPLWEDAVLHTLTGMCPGGALTAIPNEMHRCTRTPLPLPLPRGPACPSVHPCVQGHAGSGTSDYSHGTAFLNW